MNDIGLVDQTRAIVEESFAIMGGFFLIELTRLIEENFSFYQKKDGIMCEKTEGLYISAYLIMRLNKGINLPFDQ